MFEKLNQVIERKLMPIANRLSSQRHLKAIRDAFISLLPITLAGGIVAVLNAAPVTETTTNGFLLAWKAFADSNSFLFGWVNALTLGAMSLYICIGITYFLCRHYKLVPFQPILLSVFGFLLLMMTPLELGWAGKTVEISYLDGKGLLPAIFIAIFAVEAYQFMRSRNWGRIKLPDSVPASLSETFASLVPSIVVIGVYVAIFAGFNAYDTTLPQFIYKVISPTLSAADSLPFTILITLAVHLFWFFGIHDAALAGILGPIRDGNLSINAAAQMAGQALPATFTTSFWVYFVIIGGCGSVLALAILLVRSKSKQLRTVGGIGILPAFFGISEPIIFGVPLMLNPIFFIPFLLTSTVNAIISFILISNGFIEKTFAMLSWNMPNVFGAFLSTMDWKAAVLVIFLIILDAIIYYPFFKTYERNLVKLENEPAVETVESK
ncbi:MULTISPECIES: PTS transporter subunit EIIC [unclassified Breznakia]|uniref:PTS sugar transporter subunit IIC n=1 Tax=unclassified Breznakia TaxID=2623764 RepID=UPI0024753FB7|nr:MULTISPECIES: PTS transporter subunit EIIC [unclassified Breznakia]MDH6367009.1 PTS system cellobiose-specific IIC component [Breznakia sp. PH1-1]MDH6404219.1 PTS system cellobiose-specific IIC component [Breznakia sp. PF1-11]MDH6411896.1 PTS system cellobiose-specific IIC component [Breznakia sp. PFB1-11]MDH6414207.1 PTS system cellobiose-specific IIC component [Breznakia sp. PFB1-14]MDH6415969.1 PTS system cellobiose-specific IIC component [Breznakia sp. PFB1-4]